MYGFSSSATIFSELVMTLIRRPPQERLKQLMEAADRAKAIEITPKKFNEAAEG
jgi:hypothetical protein